MNALVLDLRSLGAVTPKHGDLCLCYNIGASNEDFRWVIGKYNGYQRLFQNPAFWCDNGDCKDSNGTYVNVGAWAKL